MSDALLSRVPPFLDVGSVQASACLVNRSRAPRLGRRLLRSCERNAGPDPEGSWEAAHPEAQDPEKKALGLVPGGLPGGSGPNVFSPILMVCYCTGRA